MEETKLKMNYWVIIATGVAAFFLSIFWYSPLLFGKIWEQYRHAPNPEIPQWTMAFAPLRELIVSFVLAGLIIRLNLTNWKNTTQLILLLWFAFHAVGMAGAILWDNMQWELGAVHAGDWLMKMVFMGIVLTKWLNKKSSTIKLNNNMKEFVLLFRMNITNEDAQPTQKQMESYMQQWMSWINGIAENDQLADGGNHFSRQGRVLKPNNEVVDTPHIADNNSIAGYIIIFANNLDEATKIAEKCPILNGQNTSVEIRETAAPGE